MIEVKNLTKRYGDKFAIDDISFQINEGEIVGFLGPNGAGKTTTMNIMTGYLAATDGTVEVSGYDIVDDPIEVKKRIGYLPEQPPLYMDMTVSDYLSFVYGLKKLKLNKTEHIARIMELVKITHVKDRLIKNLSKGYKQRVGLAQALLGDPEFLILDEPTVGLDPKQITEIRDVIRQLGKEHTIMISSHILQEISAMCSRVIIISNGKIVASDTIESMSAKLAGKDTQIIRIAGDRDKITEALNSVEGVESVTSQFSGNDNEYDYIVGISDSTVRNSIFRKMAEIDCPVVMMKNNSISLEDIFLQVTDVREEEQK